LNDVFLAAAYRALASQGGWDGTSGLRISITVDLRRWCPSCSFAPSICNLSSFEYPFLVRNLGRNFDETLANVAAVTRRRKRSWPGLVPALVGHFLMKRHGYEDLVRAGLKERKRRRSRAGRPLTLSNEGSLDKVRLRFGTKTPVSAHILPPFLALPDVHICLSSYAGRLTLAAVTPRNGQEIVERFLDTLLEQFPIRTVAHANAQRETPVAVQPIESVGSRQSAAPTTVRATEGDSPLVRSPKSIPSH